ncbi:MAG: hypothetical protein REI95_11250 [Oxalicibacterium faecigallinarum]|uniref:hypothetical protein n=1 Tax=Oxalicibacterium faecigallinarum TaxID=573741 RepID=UPI00280980D5|nr:hypothetical protein [Oxalicibacterium faecigallinarum]MDQ7970208.1 hypothetical protein [Oxalicibacterium faecigallinarum]
MVTKDERAQFAAELKQRFEALATWAIEQSPDKASPLTRADFDAARKEITVIAEGKSDMGDRNAAVPEPSEDGPQYVNVNPAPWP